VLLSIPCALAAPARASTLPSLRPPAATGSYYVRSVDPDAMRRTGCRAGARRAHGIVILDFGRLGYNGHSYGTLTFSRRFAANRAITRAMTAFARGYGFMARQWADFARLVAGRYGRVVPFAGLMTQHRSGCRTCGLRPHEAHRVLVRSLPRWLQQHVRRLPALTNIHPQDVRPSRRAPR
jgi:hypothetical protein